jgi:hypothetical protein
MSVIAHSCIEREFVSAKGIVAIRFVIRVGEHAEITGFLVMGQDCVLVELA